MPPRMNIATARRTLTLLLAVALLGSSLLIGSDVPASAAPGGSGKPKVAAPTPVSVRSMPPASEVAASAGERAATSNAHDLISRRIDWPTPGPLTMDRLEAVELGATRESLETAGRVMGRAVTKRSGIHGVLVKVNPDRGAEQQDISIDYAGFAHAFGAHWASRLQVVRYPGCFLERPNDDKCTTATDVPAMNDLETQTVTADVPSATTQQGGYIALVARAASVDGSGDFAATPLAPSSTWSAGGSSGGFSWNYPLRMPPANNGPAPQVGLAYNSQTVDGRTPGTNNQSSVAGEGFDIASASVQRNYVPCNDDGAASGKHDLCWHGDNATLTLNGTTNELVEAADGTWRLTNDDGSRIRRLTGTSANNQDNDKEYWELTTPDGTRYYFGRSSIPGQSGNPESVWTVPVVGNNAGEPCNNKGSTYATRFCDQAWRWNLDYVVDTHGNAMSYWYEQETNRYQQNGTSSEQYVRGGRITRIDYGLREGVDNTTPPFRVNFGRATRCLEDSGCADYTNGTWPDTPFDQICNNQTNCTTDSPTFFTRFLLPSVTTKLLTGGAYSDVESWEFSYRWLNSGRLQDSVLALKTITRKGLAGPSALITPSTVFNYDMRDNRVNGAADGISGLARPRLASIVSETGASTSVFYLDSDCGATKPAPATNTKRCFPQKWTPQGATNTRTDWFTKYVVDQVSVQDRTGYGDTQRTYYEYVGGGAWAYDNDKLIPPSYRTWSDWRGYETVITRTGDPASSNLQTKQVSTYFRGMDGDRTASGGTKNAEVADSTGTTMTDSLELAGFERERVIYEQDGGPVHQGTIYTPWTKQTAGSGKHQANLVAVKTEDRRYALAGGGWRRGKVENVYDPVSGEVTRTSDHGDLDVPDDQICTATEYQDITQANGTWLLGHPSKVARSRGLCGTDALAPPESKALSIERLRYAGTGISVDRGLVTQKDRLKDYVDGSPTFQLIQSNDYDNLGRLTSQAVPAATGNTRTTTFGYGMTADRTQTSLTTTEDATGKAFATTEAQDPAWGVPTKVTDPNAKTTTAKYDALGRVTAVWLANRATSSTPSSEFDYSLSKTVPSTITSRTLNTNGTGYITQVDLYDALLRPLQTHVQAASSGGGWVIDTTHYDTFGQVDLHAADVYCTTGTGCSDATITDLYGFDPRSAPAVTEYSHDGLGRVTKESFTQPEDGEPNNTKTWATTTTYAGTDKTTVQPPSGGTATRSTTDIRGRTTSSTRLGTPAITTSYIYDLNDNQTEVSNPSGTWTFDYDLRDRLVATTDPDAGATTRTYTDNDLLATSTDAEQRVLGHEYDALDRPTQVSETVGAQTRPLTTWSYDTLAKGRLDSTTRTVGTSGDTITTAVTGYNPLYNPTGQRITLTPATGGSSLLTGLPTSYQWATTYNTDQSVRTHESPTVTDPTSGQRVLSGEVITYGYNSVGLPVSAGGRTGIYRDAIYDELGDLNRLTVGTGSANQIYLLDTYDVGSRRLERSLALTNTSQATVSEHLLTYDDAGNLLKDADTATGDTQCYAYDDHQRLSDAWTPSNANCDTAPAQATLGGPAPYRQKWTFTAAGLRETQLTQTPDGSFTDTYTYPSAGQSQPHAPRSISRSGAGVSTYTYDQTGNTTSRPKAVGETGEQQVTWNAEGKPATLTDANGGTTNYAYGTNGEQLLVDSTDTRTLYLGDTEVRLDKSTNTVSAQRFYATPAAASAVRSDDNTIDFVIQDPHGTGQTTLPGIGLDPTHRYLTPYGQERDAGSGPAWPTQRGFLDKTADPTTGLTSIGARQYDPSTGSFISVDPVLDTADPHQMLGYAYANQNPVTFSDPTGLFAVSGESGGSTGSDNLGSSTKVEPTVDTSGSATTDDPTWTQAESTTVGGTPQAGWVDPAELDEVAWVFRTFVFDYTQCGSGGSGVGCGAEIVMIIPFAKPLKALKLAEQGLEVVHDVERAEDAVSSGADATSGVLRNKAIGDEASDRIAARYPGAQREVTLQAASGPRRLDVLTEQGLAIESKVGRTGLTRRTRQELARDVELLNDPTSPVTSLMWEFSRSPITGRGGPSSRLASELLRNGIPWTVVG